MALEGSAGFGLGTLSFKLASFTCARRSTIFIVLTLFKKLASFQSLSGRTIKGVSFSIVAKSLFGKDTFFGAGTFLSFFQRFKMRFDAAIPAGQIIFDAAVFAVGYRSFNCCLGVFFMSVN